MGMVRDSMRETRGVIPPRFRGDRTLYYRSTLRNKQTQAEYRRLVRQNNALRMLERILGDLGEN